MFGRIMHLKSILVNMLVWSQKAEQYLYIDQNYLLFIKMWPQKGFYRRGAGSCAFIA